LRREFLLAGSSLSDFELARELLLFWMSPEKLNGEFPL
jgi:hypothetical protein